MTNTDRATERPWSVYVEPITDKEHAKRELSLLVDGTPNFKERLVYICGPGGLAPAVTGCGERSEANAALIVHSVNSLPVALKALEEAKVCLRLALKRLHEVCGNEDAGPEFDAAYEQLIAAISTIKDSTNG